MKFVTVQIPCIVQRTDGGDLEQAGGVLELRLTASNDETPKETLARLARKLDDKLNLVDIGDCD